MRLKVPDLVFLDIKMPVMDGLQVCAAMRASVHLRHVPVVFLTANTSPQALQTALQEGATDYLIKPAQPAEILARVQCLTRMSRAQQELSKLESEFESFRVRLSTMSGKKMP
jgi:DNA-binding response OmpR family regulator